MADVIESVIEAIEAGKEFIEDNSDVIKAGSKVVKAGSEIVKASSASNQDPKQEQQRATGGTQNLIIGANVLNFYPPKSCFML